MWQGDFCGIAKKTSRLRPFAPLRDTRFMFNAKTQRGKEPHDSMHARPHGMHARPHGMHARPHGMHAPPHGMHARPHGMHAPPHGMHAPPHGMHAPLHGMHARLHEAQYVIDIVSEGPILLYTLGILTPPNPPASHIFTHIFCSVMRVRGGEGFQSQKLSKSTCFSVHCGDFVATMNTNWHIFHRRRRPSRSSQV